MWGALEHEEINRVLSIEGIGGNFDWIGIEKGRYKYRPRLFGQLLPSQVWKLTNMDLMMKTYAKVNS